MWGHLLVRGGCLDVVKGDYFDRTFFGFQFEAQLFLDSSEDGGAGNFG